MCHQLGGRLPRPNDDLVKFSKEIYVSKQHYMWNHFSACTVHVRYIHACACTAVVSKYMTSNYFRLFWRILHTSGWCTPMRAGAASSLRETIASGQPQAKSAHLPWGTRFTTSNAMQRAFKCMRTCLMYCNISWCHHFFCLLRRCGLCLLGENISFKLKGRFGLDKFVSRLGERRSPLIDWNYYMYGHVDGMPHFR